MPQCNVCPHRCVLSEGQTGLCRARSCRDGHIVCTNYGRLTSVAVDPIEKKPLSHFHPHSQILSVGSYGCNLRCFFCQNHHISMVGADEAVTETMSAQSLAELAIGLSRTRGNIGVAFTYNEPLISYEYIMDVSPLLHEAGLFSVVVTNGCILPEVAELVLPHIDALNIDLKAFTDGFYQKNKGDLETVKTFIMMAAETSHVELTTLVVPGENDSPEEMDALSTWVASVNPDIPLHVTRFFPRYQAIRYEPTDVDTLRKLVVIAREHLTYVEIGNV